MEKARAAAARSLRKLCELDAAGERTLEMAVRKLGLSPRTVADLDHKDQVAASHLAEASACTLGKANY